MTDETLELVDNEQEIEETIEDADGSDNGDEGEELELDFGGEDEGDEPGSLADIKAAILNDPDTAVKRIDEVERGLEKLKARDAESRAKVEELEQTTKGIENLWAAVSEGNQKAIESFNEYLVESTGFSLTDLAEVVAGNTPAPKRDDSKLTALEQRIEQLAQSDKARAWKLEKGESYAKVVSTDTGFNVSADDIYAVLPQLKGKVSSRGVLDAIKQHNPAAYIRIIENANEPAKGVPKAALAPSGRRAGSMPLEHSDEGWFRAKQAQKQR